MPRVIVLGINEETSAIQNGIVYALSELPYSDNITISFVSAYEAVRVSDRKQMAAPCLFVVSTVRKKRDEMMKALRTLPFLVFSVGPDAVKLSESTEIVPASD